MRRLPRYEPAARLAHEARVFLLGWQTMAICRLQRIWAISILLISIIR